MICENNTGSGPPIQRSTTPQLPQTIRMGREKAASAASMENSRGLCTLHMVDMPRVDHAIRKVCIHLTATGNLCFFHSFRLHFDFVAFSVICISPASSPRTSIWICSHSTSLQCKAPVSVLARRNRSRTTDIDNIVLRLYGRPILRTLGPPLPQRLRRVPHRPTAPSQEHSGGAPSMASISTISSDQDLTLHLSLYSINLPWAATLNLRATSRLSRPLLAIGRACSSSRGQTHKRSRFRRLQPQTAKSLSLKITEAAWKTSHFLNLSSLSLGVKQASQTSNSFPAQ